jgi:hypothetical protein
MYPEGHPIKRGMFRPYQGLPQDGYVSAVTHHLAIKS